MNCKECKYFIKKVEICILGRRANYCTGDPARRGDDELIARFGEIVNQLDSDFIKKFKSEIEEE